MNLDNFAYMLRFTVQPGHHEEERLKLMVDFCEKARIDDVMFLINCEEMNRGHITIEETEPWLEMIRRGGEMLAPLGVTTSINPWITLLHCDRGRRLKEGQNFTTMTDACGNKASAVACPLCDDWRSYITGMYAYYASIKPNVLWVEDDFRLHNHDSLIWGGCFCDRHMEEYSKRAGKKLDRAEFAQAIVKQGDPHPYRKIWLDVSRDVMVETAELIGDAVKIVSSETRVGLMCSNPIVHCAEGRDWHGILKGLAGDMPMVLRPHLPAYSDVTPQTYIKNITRISGLTCAVVPAETEIYPELECFPYSRFSKSRSFMGFQLETSVIFGADGITLNIFDMMGNGVIMSEGYHKVLADIKDRLTAIKAFGLKSEKQTGVRIPVSTKASYSIHTSEGKSIRELYPKESFFAELLTCYSIANTYSTEKEFNGEIVAVSGQYLRNLDALELKKLFENNFVILNGEAADTLVDMGYGQLAGIRSAKWHKVDNGFQAYEQVCDGSIYCGIEEARISSQAFSGDFLEIEYLNTECLRAGYDEEVRLKTTVRNPHGEVVAPGMALFRDRVLVLPYGNFTEGFQSHLGSVRQAIFQDILKKSKAGGSLVLAEGEPQVALYHFELGDKKILILINASMDNLDEVRIFAPTFARSMAKDGIMQLAAPGNGLEKADIKQDGQTIILNDGLKAMELKLLVR